MRKNTNLFFLVIHFIEDFIKYFTKDFNNDFTKGFTKDFTVLYGLDGLDGRSNGFFKFLHT